MWEQEQEEAERIRMEKKLEARRLDRLKREREEEEEEEKRRREDDQRRELRRWIGLGPLMYRIYVPHLCTPWVYPIDVPHGCIPLMYRMGVPLVPWGWPSSPVQGALNGCTASFPPPWPCVVASEYGLT